MAAEGNCEQIFYPPWGFTKPQWDKIKAYYAADSHRNHELEIVHAIYGGLALPAHYNRLEAHIAGQTSDRRVHLTLHHKDDPQKTVHLKDVNFNQWLIESSRLPDPGSPKGWAGLDPQTRIEICQNELARWSVKLKTREGQDQWNGQRTAPGLDISGDRECDEIELINNCTTSWGFEIKVWVNGAMYHGSVKIPQQVYRTLCREQAGAWARQGWFDPNDQEGRECGLLGDGVNNSFRFSAGIYGSEHHADPRITIDLNRYRSLSNAHPPSRHDIKPDNGKIDYRRWGDDKEYVEKPFARHLVMDADATAKTPGQFVSPPDTYAEVQSHAPRFKLPDFKPNGVYTVYEPTSKAHYAQLADLTTAVIHRTEQNLDEVILERSSPCHPLELHRIVLGNLDLATIREKGKFFTLDRFCFNPRPTSDLYCPKWKPAVERYGHARQTPYGFLLAQPPDQGQNRGVFIQPESWGVERAVLSFEGSGRNVLVIDLISFERIVPVWQGRIDLSARFVERTT